MNKLIRLTAFCCIYIYIISCDDSTRRLNTALEMAGENKSELLKVINHYKQNPADSLKLKAARFLIENMPYHFAYDTAILHHYRPVVEKINVLRTKGTLIEDIQVQVNPMMDSLVSIHPISHIYSATQNDLDLIKSDLLINTIEQSFEAYNNNPFKDSIQFNDFLEYVLPYRIYDGYCLENWRSYFLGRFSLRDKSDFTSVQQLCDYLLYNFRRIKIADKVATQYPYLMLGDYLKSKTSNCSKKCWFNCMFLRSFGVPVTIDFVPVSRVHEFGHEWNAIKLENGIYPFDPFWEETRDKRYLKSYYERKVNHPEIGSIQFPKVYRKTYRMNPSELLNHSISSGEEIPPLFRNPFFKDVTDEYFKTFTFEIPIVRNIKDINYAYACVNGKDQRWIPVDYGKIHKKKVLFSTLGSKNVYLPAYYKNGSSVPAAYPFLIDQDESISILCPDTLHTRNIKLSYVAYSRPVWEKYKQSLIGCAIEGSNYPNFKNSQVLYRINKAYEPGNYHIPINSTFKYRYIRFKIQSRYIRINELKFFNATNKSEKEITGKLISSTQKGSSFHQNMMDGNKLTAVDFMRMGLPNNCWIGYDFGRPVSISSFEFYYALDINIKDGGLYELLYWDFGWKSLGVQTSESNSVYFENVPQNALLMIKILDTNKYSRPFTYSGGKQHWW